MVHKEGPLGASRLSRYDCMLDFGRTFYLDCGVPADDEVTSLTGAGGDAGNGAFAFTTTHWSVVLAAQDRSPAAEAALEKLCRTYWWPLYGFVRRNGFGPEEAQDLTQGFFALLLERRELALRRGEGRALVPLDELLARERADLEPADMLSADRIYERRWALTLLEQVLARLEEEYRVAGNARLFEQLKQRLTDESDRPSQAEIAQELSMSENAVKQAFHRLRQRYRLLLREEIAHTVALPGDVQDELRHFIAVLQA